MAQIIFTFYANYETINSRFIHPGKLNIFQDTVLFYRHFAAHQKADGLPLGETLWF